MKKSNRLVLILSQLLASFALTATLSAAVQADTAEEAIAARIKPVGEVCVKGEDCGSAAAPAAAVASGPRSGEEIYNTKCMACHGSGALGAPKVGNAGDWSPRAAQGFDTLITHAVSGFNSMPPRGACADCSDEEISNAVHYMVEHSQ